MHGIIYYTNQQTRKPGCPQVVIIRGSIDGDLKIPILTYDGLINIDKSTVTESFF